MKHFKEDNYFGEAINFWIQNKGSLDLDTNKEEILEFYKQQTENYT